MSHQDSADDKSRPFLTRAYGLTSVEGARALYDEWAASYDNDLADPSHDWVAPAIAAGALLDLLDGSKKSGNEMEILDAGCGTGLVGTALAKQTEAKPSQLKLHIDGIDLSTGMLEMAKKTGAYRSLSTADMSKALDIKKNYDACICIGVLTQGHVGPAVLREFVSVLKSGGYVVATVREDIWASAGYQAAIEELEREGKVKVLSTESLDSLRGAKITMKLPVLQKL
jgi:predicted TPR repeat methyltransferase